MPLRLLPVLLLAALFSGCVSTYRGVRYERLAYAEADTSHGVRFAYQPDAQPGRWGRAARRAGYRVVAVRATNTTAAPVVLDSLTLRVAAGGVPLRLLRPDVVACTTRQPVLPYALVGAPALGIPNDPGTVALAVGVPVALSGLAMFQSAHENRRAARHFRDEHLLGRRLAPGETAHGLLFLQAPGGASLQFQYTPGGAVPAPPVPAPPVTAPVPTE